MVSPVISDPTLWSFNIDIAGTPAVIVALDVLTVAPCVPVAVFVYAPDGVAALLYLSSIQTVPVCMP
jgi:hypothetical protein